MITRRAICIWRSIEELLCKHCCSGKSKAPYSHLFPAPLYPIFSTLSHKSNDFRKKKITEHKMCVLIFSTTFVWNISNSNKKWANFDYKKYVYWTWCISSLIILRFYKTLCFSTDFRNIFICQCRNKCEQQS